MPELHETIMGRRLIEHTLPEIGRQLERIANVMEKNNVELVKLKERYNTLSELDADPKSKHQMHIKICKQMDEVLSLIKNA
jgi:hypothetical protein